jgi:hypothetical protein
LEQSYTLDGLVEKELIDLYELTKWRKYYSQSTPKNKSQSYFFSPGLIIMFKKEKKV